MHIETERLLIRDFCKTDLHSLHAILSDAETMQFMESPYTLPQTELFLKDFCIGRRGAFAVHHRGDDRMIGYLLFKPCGESDVYEIGWLFSRAYWRQGLAYEACAALIRYGFLRMDIHKIFAETIDPVRSVGLMRKLGMQPEGVQRLHTRDNTGAWADVHLYGLLREDHLRREAFEILPGKPDDIEPWMALVSAVRGNFPGLETEKALQEHRDTVLRLMTDGRALCAKCRGQIAGVLLFSRKRNQICCLAVAPEFRRRGAATQLLAAALAQLDRTRAVTVSTFRAGDPLGDAPRALYTKFGFFPGELTIEFDHPNQIFTLPAKE